MTAAAVAWIAARDRQTHGLRASLRAVPQLTIVNRVSRSGLQRQCHKPVGSPAGGEVGRAAYTRTAALADLEALDAAALADRVHALLLPGVPPSADSCRILADKLRQTAIHLQQTANAASQLASATLYKPAALQPIADEVPAVQNQTAAFAVPKLTGQPPSGRSKRKLGALGTIKSHFDQCAGSTNSWRTAAKPFLMEAYQQRFVALEVFYLGWRYHGFASQSETDGTVEVCYNLLQCLAALSLPGYSKTSC